MPISAGPPGVNPGANFVTTTALAAEMAAHVADTTAVHGLTDTATLIGLVNAPLGFLRRATPTWVSTFQSGHGWTDPIGGGTITADTDDFIIGTQSVRVTNADGTNAAIQKASLTYNLTDKCLALWVKIDNLDADDYLVVYAGNTGFTAYYSWVVKRKTDQAPWFTDGEWALVTLPVESATVTGSPAVDALTVLRVRAFTSGTFHLNAIGTVPSGIGENTSGVCSITCDDGYDDVIEAAREVFTPKGLRGTAYIIPDRIGTSGFMTVAELQELQNVHGWDIQAHGETAYTSMTAAEMRAEWTATKQWFTDNGLGRPEHLAYVGGQSNATVVATAREYWSTARTVTSTHVETWPPAMPHRLRAVSSITGYAGGTSIATTQGYIDDAETGGHWVILAFHQFVDSPAATTQCSWADLGTLADYINTSGIAVKTVAEATHALRS
jgi:peptidoglycan/xylan/chitin deacetylase (PgdA/CDA1 family)